MTVPLTVHDNDCVAAAGEGGGVGAIDGCSEAAGGGGGVGAIDGCSEAAGEGGGVGATDGSRVTAGGGPEDVTDAVPEGVAGVPEGVGATVA